MIPSPWEAALLALAAWRIWMLLAEDTILDTPRAWVLRRLDATAELFLTCPRCAGFWLGLLLYGAWWAWGDSTLVVLLPFAINAAVAFLAVAYDKIAA